VKPVGKGRLVKTGKERKKEGKGTFQKTVLNQSQQGQKKP